MIESSPCDDKADELADFVRGFHSVALFAYTAVAADTAQSEPDSEKVRRTAYELFDAELRRKTSQPEPAN